MPLGGYTGMVANMLDHENIKVELGTDFFENRADFEKSFDRIVYSGKVDELFDYKYGLLEYRSLRFWQRRYDHTYQGNSIINYTDDKIPYTRVVEHKYFEKTNLSNSVVTFEYPDSYDERKIPFYPMPTEKNAAVYAKYKEEADNADQYVIGGRLGRYVYLNMDQVIGMALKDARAEID
jgi:UDP-galactopyranose mutase